MGRASFNGSTICYLEIDNKVLFIKFHEKWAGKYCGPGGKMELGESPTECITREFYEETGLTLKDLRFCGIAQWIHKEKSGFIFVFHSKNVSGNIDSNGKEGRLEWIEKDRIKELEEFPINKKLTEYIFGEENNVFEGKFIIDDNNEIINHEIKKM